MKFLSKTAAFLILITVFSGAALAEPMMDVIYEDQVLVEMGWTRYITIGVENSGDEELSNVMVSFVKNRDWFEVRTNQTDLNPGQSEEFLVKVMVPENIEAGVYKMDFSVDSFEKSEVRPITLQVFSSKTEMLLHQLKELRARMDVLKNIAEAAESSGKEISDIKISLEGAEGVIDAGEKLVSNQHFNDAVDKIKNAEYLLTEAEYELSVAEESQNEEVSTETDWSLIIIIFIVIALIFISLRNKKLSGGRIGKILKGRDIKIKEFIETRIGDKKLDKKAKEIKESQSLLDEEYKKKIISKESYEELSSLNQQKLLELGKKR